MRNLFAKILLLLSLCTLPTITVASSTVTVHVSAQQAARIALRRAKRLTQKAPKSSSSVSSQVVTTPQVHSSYAHHSVFIPYSPDVLKHPGTIILFFAPYECGSSCKMRHSDLLNLYKIGTYPFSTYEVSGSDPDYPKLAHPLRMTGNLDGFIRATVNADGSVTYAGGVIHPFDDELKLFLLK